jgi:hypothetical protein
MLTGESSPSAAAQVFDAVIRSRGVVLDEMVARARLMTTGGSSAAPLVKELHSARQRFATLVLRSLEVDEAVSPAALDAAQRDKERAERAIADHTAEARVVGPAEMDAGLSEIRRALPKNSALVSYVRHSVPTLTTGSASSADAYVAFVVRSDRNTLATKSLGAAASIECWWLIMIRIGRTRRGA